MSANHRISLTANWKLEKRPLPDNSQVFSYSASRVFHCPTGLRDGQIVSFVLGGLEQSMEFFLNEIPVPPVIVEGLMTFPIQTILQPSNRVEIRWAYHESGDVLKLPESFAAWLEISDTKA